MVGLAAIGGGAFVVACLVLGVRLLWLWRATRQLPELCIGLGLLLMGGLGYPLLVVATHAPISDATRLTVMCAYLTCSVAGNVAVCVFNWKVFRPSSGWAPLLTHGIAGALCGLAAAQAWRPGLLAFALEQSGPWSLSTFVTSVVYTWAGSESALYYRQMRKRMRLGLADPEVADRFRLWALGTLSAVAISAIGMAFKALGLDFRASVAGGLTIGSLGLVTAVAMWLAFLPPEGYRARVRGRAAPARPLS